MPSRLLLGWMLAALLAACSGVRAPSSELRRFVLLHSGDQESAILERRGTGGVARFVSLRRELEARAGLPVLTVGAGDSFIPAPQLSLELDGKSAVSLANNLLGLSASALGNHEFDLGESFLADMIRAAKFPYLTCSFDVEGGPLAPLVLDVDALPPGTDWAELHPGKILTRAKACVGGSLVADAGGGFRCTGTAVGLVGTTTEHLRQLTKGSSHVRPSADFAELRTRLQAQIDALTADGIDIVVVLSHLQGVEREMQLIASGLVGADVFVSGGGENRLADRPEHLLPVHDPDPLCKQEAPHCFPIVRRAADGAPVAITATDGHFAYIGQLAMSFDAAGRLVDADGMSRPIPVSDRSLARQNVTLVGDAKALEQRVATALEPLTAPIGWTTVYLNGERASVRHRETNLGNLSADAILFAARGARPDGAPEPLLSIKNGGGIRSSIGAVDSATFEKMGGPITELDIRTAFRFDNGVVVATLPEQLLIDTLNIALNSGELGGGAFPQVSDGTHLEFVRDAESGLLRVENLAIAQPGASPRVIAVSGSAIAPERPITLATLNFLARGGDRYFEGATDRVQVIELEAAPGLPLGEQVAIRRYLASTYVDANRYPDPDPELPESFHRVRPLLAAAGKPGKPAASTGVRSAG